MFVEWIVEPTENSFGYFKMVDYPSFIFLFDFNGVQVTILQGKTFEITQEKEEWQPFPFSLSTVQKDICEKEIYSLIFERLKQGTVYSY